MIGSAVRRFVESRWYGEPGCLRALTPLESLFRFISRRRRVRQSASASLPPIPLVVVGNISVGGTGKTPTLIAIIKCLQERGWTPGVVSRGFGRQGDTLCEVSPGALTSQVGDEPKMLFDATQCVVVSSSSRVEAVDYIVAQGHCDIILADDGLQHYRMARDLEIAIVDGGRMLGNRRLLPVGPLREPPERLREVDWVLVNLPSGSALTALGDGLPEVCQIEVKAVSITHLASGEVLPLSALHDLGQVTAVAGLGNPAKYFCTLDSLDVDYVPLPFPDHHQYSREDFIGLKQKCVLMTAKDAVKCLDFAETTWYSLNVEMVLPKDFLNRFCETLSQVKRHRQQ